MKGNSALIEETLENSLALPPGGDTARRLQTMNQKTGPRQTPNLPVVPSSWTSQSPEL